MQALLHASGVVILRFQDRLDADLANKGRPGLKELTRKGHSRFIVDLKDTHFIDSQGLAILVSLLKASNSMNGTVCLASPGNGVKRLLDVTQLDKVFDIYASVEEALSALS